MPNEHDADTVCCAVQSIIDANQQIKANMGNNIFSG